MLSYYASLISCEIDFSILSICEIDFVYQCRLISDFPEGPVVKTEFSTQGARV